MQLQQGTLLQGGKYKIEKCLGQGSFGITYHAKMKSIISGGKGRTSMWVDVAVKEFFMKDFNSRKPDGSLNESTGSTIVEKYKKDFKKEAENLAKMEHPGIVDILDTFEEKNTCYLVMAYINGQSLDEYIAIRGIIPENEALLYMEKIADALHYMHCQRMLHLDLKPKNIMRSKENATFIIDFGLSKQYDENDEPESSTTLGQGTQGYAPIEQGVPHSGHEFPVTIDVYALGATFYKILTGKTPPYAATILSTPDIIKKNLEAKNVSRNTISRINKAMSPRKEDRYTSVAEFMKVFGWKVNYYPKVTKEIEVDVVNTTENTIVETQSKRDAISDQQKTPCYVNEKTKLVSNNSFSIDRDVSHIILRFDNESDDARNVWIITSNSIEKTLSLGTVEKYRILQNDYNRIIRFLNDMHLERNPNAKNILQENSRRIVIKKGGNIIYNKKIDSSNKFENEKFSEFERIVINIFEKAKDEFSKSKASKGAIYGIIKSLYDHSKLIPVDPSTKQNYKISADKLLNNSFSIDRDVSHIILRFDNEPDKARNVWIITSNSIEKTLSLGTVEKYRILQNDYNRIIRFLNDMHLEHNPMAIKISQENGGRIVIKKGGNIIYNHKIDSSDKLKNDKFSELERVVLKIFENSKKEFAKNKAGDGVLYGVIKSKNDSPPSIVTQSKLQNSDTTPKRKSNTFKKNQKGKGFKYAGVLGLIIVGLHISGAYKYAYCFRDITLEYGCYPDTFLYGNNYEVYDVSECFTAKVIQGSDWISAKEDEELKQGEIIISSNKSGKERTGKVKITSYATLFNFRIPFISSNSTIQINQHCTKSYYNYIADLKKAFPLSSKSVKFVDVWFDEPVGELHLVGKWNRQLSVTDKKNAGKDYQGFSEEIMMMLDKTNDLELVYGILSNENNITLQIQKDDSEGEYDLYMEIDSSYFDYARNNLKDIIGK